MYKTRNPFLLFSAFAALFSFAGCPSNPNANCDENPGDPSCNVDCSVDPLNPVCGVNCQDFPTLFQECQDCSQHPDDSAFCDCANPILLTSDECCEQDPDDPFCQTTNNPHPNGGGAGDSGCAPIGTEVCTNNNQDEGFDNDCNGIADDGCDCSSATEDQLSCYTGPAGTRGVGTCEDGIAFCEGVTIDGDETWGSCVGQTLPLPNDDCGNPPDTGPSDTNCNGIVGDGCSALVATCPAEIFAAPLQTRTLTATAVPSGGTITSTVWTISQRPVGSTTGPTPANSPTTNLFLDVAGDYTMTFTAQDSFGASGSCSTIVHAVPTENLRIELSWDTATDIDSHLLHPNASQWNSSPLDCFYINCDQGSNLSWPGAGTADDPRLDIDDVNGFGPENINVDQPEFNTANPYTFGAYHFSGSALSDITIRIFCGGVVKAQLTHLDLPNNELWKVANIAFTTSTTCNVIPIDTVVPMTTGGAIAR